MLVILLNCVTLGMYQPCVDDQCLTNRCKILQVIALFFFNLFIFICKGLTVVKSESWMGSTYTVQGPRNVSACPGDTLAAMAGCQYLHR